MSEEADELPRTSSPLHCHKCTALHGKPLLGTAGAPIHCTALHAGCYFLSSVKCLGGRAHYKIATIIIITKLTKENHLILHKPMLTTIWLG